MQRARVIGAGLAGSEAAWQLAGRGVPVELYEMRPALMTAAHKTGAFAELVCSNSLGNGDTANASGLLKEELRRLGSLVIAAADHARVPAGAALAVDRAAFSSYIDRQLRNHPLIEVVAAEAGAEQIAAETITVIAGGPLTSPALARALRQLTGEDNLAFFDAISPIVTLASLDQSFLFRASRYGKGGGDDYLNVPLDREQYYRLVEEVNAAQKHNAHPEIDNLEPLQPFEGCMPIEDLIARGADTLRFGSLKPKGLVNPRTGREPFAVIQLRQDNQAGTLWSMVGFQTRMQHPEQVRIFRSLPGFAAAEFVRLGSVHRNTFINSPRCLDATLQFRLRRNIFCAGQLTGTEGYAESIAGGLVAGLNAARLARGQSPLVPPSETALGTLLRYISDPARRNFQPMNVNFGLFPSYLDPALAKLPKKERRKQIAAAALAAINGWANDSKREAA